MCQIKQTILFCIIFCPLQTWTAPSENKQDNCHCSPFEIIKVDPCPIMKNTLKINLHIKLKAPADYCKGICTNDTNVSDPAPTKYNNLEEPAPEEDQKPTSDDDTSLFMKYPQQVGNQQFSSHRDKSNHERTKDSHTTTHSETYRSSHTENDETNKQDKMNTDTRTSNVGQATNGNMRTSHTGASRETHSSHISKNLQDSHKSVQPQPPVTSHHGQITHSQRASQSPIHKPQSADTHSSSSQSRQVQIQGSSKVSHSGVHIQSVQKGQRQSQSHLQQHKQSSEGIVASGKTTRMGIERVTDRTEYYMPESEDYINSYDEYEYEELFYKEQPTLQRRMYFEQLPTVELVPVPTDIHYTHYTPHQHVYSLDPMIIEEPHDTYVYPAAVKTQRIIVGDRSNTKIINPVTGVRKNFTDGRNHTKLVRSHVEIIEPVVEESQNYTQYRNGTKIVRHVTKVKHVVRNSTRSENESSTKNQTYTSNDG